VLFSVFCVHFPSANNQQQNATTWIRMGGRGRLGAWPGAPRHLARRIRNFLHTKLFANILFFALIFTFYWCFCHAHAARLAL